MLLPLSAFEPILAPRPRRGSGRVARGRRVGYVRLVGTGGDQLIEAATFQLFDRERINYRVVNPDPEGPINLDGCTVIAIAGGGNMGTFWGRCWEIRRRVLAEARVPVIVLPQTYRNAEEQTYSHVFVRDLTSVSFVPQGASIAPDLALGYELPYCPMAATEQTGVWLFKEARWPEWVAADRGDPCDVCQTVFAYFQLAAQFEHVITNRLHFAIAARLAGRRATLLPGDYHKCRSVWETWLRHVGIEFLQIRS